MTLTPSSFDVFIPADEVLGCEEITFVDNKIGLQGNLTFPIRVAVIDPPGLTTVAEESTLTIIDNDGTNVSKSIDL